MRLSIVRSAKVVAKKAAKNASKVIHPPFYKCTIKAQMATAAPPLGPTLGQRNINVQAFCKDFNNRTKEIFYGTPVAVRINVLPNRSYDLEICTPDTTWLLMRAAGIARGSECPMGPQRDIVGKLSVKHIYHIAEIKAQDKNLIGVPLKKICAMVIGTANRIGIQVQYEDLNPVEYTKFLKQRNDIVKEQLAVIEERKYNLMMKLEAEKVAAAAAAATTATAAPISKPPSK